jgi:hypothetical protein
LGTAKTIATRDHVHLPTTTVLTRVLQIHQQIRVVVQGGKQRLRQSRELFQIDAGVLAHLCLLSGDIHRDEVFAAHGAVAMLAANEAGYSPAEAPSAQAQIARWRHRYTEAADIASRGFACSPPTSVRVLLAVRRPMRQHLLGTSGGPGRQWPKLKPPVSVPSMIAGDYRRSASSSIPNGRAAGIRDSGPCD